MEPNTLYYGDCLDWMQGWEDNCVDLIYLDPPFNSKANYSMLFAGLSEEEAQFRAFCDTWRWNAAAAERYAAYENALGRPGRGAVVGLYHALGGSGMLAYITYMAERLEEMRRILKPTGSIYLHCDPTASHYLKIVMDDIFGSDHFQNEIVWCYRGMTPKANRYNAKHDILLYYRAGESAAFNRQKGTPTPESLKTYESAMRRGYNANTARNMVTVFDREKYEQAVERGDIPSGMREKDFDGGEPWLLDWWADIKILGGPNNRERMGYKTQKPLALLERIVQVSSNKGDVVLDPFCGCGTTIEAAYLLNRRWVGVDISSFAIDLIRRERPHLKDLKIPAHRIPQNIQEAHAMARENRLDFEAWAVERLPGFAPNMKQTGDRGVDGRGRLAYKPDDFDSQLALAQVKSGAKVSPSDLRDFIGVMARDNAAIGRFVTLEPVQSGDMHHDALSLGSITVDGAAYPRLKLWSIRDYFDGKLPELPPMYNPYKRDKIIDAAQMRMAFNTMKG